jgi:hypothetical protein
MSLSQFATLLIMPIGGLFIALFLLWWDRPPRRGSTKPPE